MLTSTGNDGGAKACSSIQWKNPLEFIKSSTNGSEPGTCTLHTAPQNKKLYQVNSIEPVSLSVTNSGLDTHEEDSKSMWKVFEWW